MSATTICPLFNPSTPPPESSPTPSVVDLCSTGSEIARPSPASGTIDLRSLELSPKPTPPSLPTPRTVSGQQKCAVELPWPKGKRYPEKLEAYWAYRSMRLDELSRNIDMIAAGEALVDQVPGRKKRESLRRKYEQDRAQAHLDSSTDIARWRARVAYWLGDRYSLLLDHTPA
ncbi:hypothetical protein FS749_015344 [Ceratobasidium sp. UAMH 11750]|nr:hypothetical protein FS749_015344 [Ceratobasidium sp. UAMH 11750]